MAKTPPTDRKDLVNRELVSMALSDGGGLTAPPQPFAADLNAAERAKLRFALRDNAIITGGAGDLALATVRGLLEHGLQGVMLLDLNPSQAELAIGALRADFPNAKVLVKKVDITDDQGVGAAVAEAVSALGSVDLLLNFAGVVGCVAAIDVKPQEFRRVLEINTTGTWLCCQAVGRQMIKQGKGGSIVLVASISGHRVNFPQPQVPYNASKTAVLSMKSSLAAEWAKYGIRVNSISPGYMDTILNEGKGLEGWRKIWASRNPMGRMGQPEELIGPIVMLCSRAGSYITGCDIVVDGGGLVF